jgi:hypothetical protein
VHFTGVRSVHEVLDLVWPRRFEPGETVQIERIPSLKARNAIRNVAPGDADLHKAEIASNLTGVIHLQKVNLAQSPVSHMESGVSTPSGALSLPICYHNQLWADVKKTMAQTMAPIGTCPNGRQW